MKISLLISIASAAVIVAHVAPSSAAALDVQVTDAVGKPLTDAAVYAEPLSSQASGRPTPAEIQQKARKFMPLMTVVQTGSEISFPNNDTVRHHVYSFSPTKPFELKLYSGNPGTPIVFDKPGTVIIGCNIHDQMVSYIQVVSTPHFGKSDDAGKVRISDLAPGKYRLKAWHYQLAPAAPPVETEITVAKNDLALGLVIGIKPAGSAN